MASAAGSNQPSEPVSDAFSEGSTICAPSNEYDSNASLMSKNKPCTMMSGSITKLEVIGSGGYSTVYKARHQAGTIMAVKVLKDLGAIPDKVEKKLKSEAQKLYELDCPYTVSLIGVILEPNNYSIVTEYMEHGNLHDFLTTYADHVTQIMRIKFIRDVILGMEYLHTRSPKSILHLDLKSHNVLIGSNFEAKLSDFGLARWQEVSATYSTRRTDQKGAGTMTHVPPECWDDINIEPDCSQDVYSFGILMWEILTGKTPFGNVREASRISHAVGRGQRPNVKEIPEGTPDYLIDMMKSSWSQEPTERPTFTELKAIIEENVSRQFDENFRLAVDQLKPHVKEAETKIPQQHGQASEEANLAASVSDVNLQEDGPGTSVVEHWTRRDQNNPVVNTNENLPIQRNTTEQIHNNVANNTNANLPIQRNTTTQIKPGMVNKNKVFLPATLHTPEYYRSTSSPVHVDAVPSPGQSAKPMTPSQTHSLPGSVAQPGGGSLHIGSTRVNYGSSAGVDTKPGQTIIHQHAGGGTTTIYNMGNADGIQIGDKNVMYVSGGTRGAAGPAHGSRRQRKKVVKVGGITESNRMITDKDMSVVADNIGQKWRNLGRQLNFVDGQLDSFHHDNHQNGLHEVIRSLLVKWTQIHDSEATAARLADALCDIKRADVAAMLDQ